MRRRGQRCGERRSRRLRVERRLAPLLPGQTFDMPVPVAGARVRSRRKRSPRPVERFHRLHEELHTYASRDQEPILRGVSLKASPSRRSRRCRTVASAEAAGQGSASAQAFFRGRFVATPIYDGRALAPGHEIVGPAIIEEPFTTIVVYPGPARAGGQVRQLRDRAHAATS
jgi:N-methylhydantoinase A